MRCACKIWSELVSCLLTDARRFHEEVVELVDMRADCRDDEQESFQFAHRAIASPGKCFVMDSTVDLSLIDLYILRLIDLSSVL